jgi:uncharacterized circularly permuted ATP-grasp superfamily protein
LRKNLKARPANHNARPALALSTVKKGLASRYVDLRPFVLVSPNSIYLTTGGLTRVALKACSLVVNLSQSGGTKYTWALRD